MPNIKSATKRMKLSAEARNRNRAARARIRTAMRKVRESASPEESVRLLREATALLDRAGTRRLLHPNRVGRLKGQLARLVNSRD
ncbi:MAG: 30S ribosomal protein S20 [Gemmatimonadetes bacterium]|nr:30S ribosomal protein S20 [Gemmatimonadota bacterium]